MKTTRAVLVAWILGACVSGQSPAPEKATSESDTVQESRVVERARELVRTHKDAEALGVLSEGVKTLPASSLLRKKRGQVYFLFDAFELSMQDLALCLASDARDEEALYLRAVCLEQLSRPVAALADYEAAARLACDAPDLARRLEAIKKVVASKRQTHESLKLVGADRRDRRYWWSRIQVELELGLAVDAEKTGALDVRVGAGDV